MHLLDNDAIDTAVLKVEDFDFGTQWRPRCPISGRGVVTLLKEEHENSASRIFSNDRDCLVTYVHSRRTKGSVCLCRNEMALDVESVVGGCVS